MSNHTPGSWYVEGSCVLSSDCLIAEASCDADSRAPYSERKSNLELIAAAPDLLGACKLFQKYASENCQGSTTTWEMVQDAMNKALGKVTQ